MPALGPDKSWMAECDANTLAEADAIKADKARMAAARKVAPKMMPDAEKGAAAAKAKLAAMKRLAKAPKKRTTARRP